MQPIAFALGILGCCSLFLQAHIAYGATCPSPLPEDASAKVVIACINELKTIQGPPLPSRVVLPFKDVVCPKGWSPYTKAAGRFVIGIGKDPRGRGYALEELGGDSRVTISNSNLPQHQHDTLIGVSPSYAIWGVGPSKTAVYGTQAAAAQTGMTSVAGEGQPSPMIVLPPYVGLLFCEKE